MFYESFVWMLKQSWFAVSPSPWSFAFYCLMAILGARKLLNQGYATKRITEISAFIDSIFLLGLIVFIQDSIWLFFNTFRWVIPYYLNVTTFFNYSVRFPENILGAVLMYLLTYHIFQSRYAFFNRKTLAYLLIIGLFTSLIFILAPNQAYTDWVYAVQMGYSNDIILFSFLISHIGYKLFIGLAFLSLFPKLRIKLK